MSVTPARPLPLDDLEQRIGLGLAVGAGAAFVVLARGAPLWLVLGGVMVLLLASSCLRRRRLPASIAAFLLTFGPWGWAYVFGVFYAAFAFWLLSRARRQALSEGTTTARPDA